MSETHGVFDTATGAGGGATASPIATTGGGGGGSIATGTAGSPNAAVISVQGITNGTPAPVSITTLPALPAGANAIGTVAVSNLPSTPPAASAPIVSTSAEATHVLKASAGSLKSVYAVNLTSTAGFLIVLNATSAPADGAVTPLAAVPLPANGLASLQYDAWSPATFGSGITVVLTSAASPFTKTTGTITGFISGSVI